MRTLIIFSLLSLIVYSCKEDDIAPNTDYTIEGNLYKNCERNPYVGLELDFYSITERSWTTEHKENYKGSVITNSNGFFSITAKFGGSYTVAKDKNNGREVFSTRTLNHLTKVEQYNHPVSYHPVKVITNKTYSNQDTIYLGAKGGKYIDALFSGPFLNNQVFENVVFHTPFLSNGYVSATSDSEIGSNIWWGFGKAQYDSLTNNGVGWDDHIIKNVNQRMCKAGDTILIDLRVLD